MTSIYKRGKLWYVKYKLDGRWVYRSLKTESKAQAELEKRALTAALQGALEDQTAYELTFERLQELYSDWSKTMRSYRTLQARIRALCRFSSCFPGLLPEQVTTAHIEQFRKWFRGEGVKNRTINETIAGLSGVYSYAIKMGLLVENPFRKIEMLKESKKMPKWLTGDEIDRVMQAAEEDSVNAHLFFAIGIYAGLRKNEILNARWGWFDFRLDFLHVQSGPYFELKDQEDRTVPLHRKLKAILERYRPEEKVLDGYLIAPQNKPKKEGYRFEIRKTYARVIRAAGVPWCNPHILRHTFASQLVAAGTDLYKVSTWLGHQSYQTTQIYAHLRPSDPDINCF